MLIDASKKGQTLPKNSDVVIVGAGTVGTRQAVEQKEDRAAMMSAAIPAAPG